MADYFHNIAIKLKKPYTKNDLIILIENSFVQLEIFKNFNSFAILREGNYPLLRMESDIGNALVLYLDVQDNYVGISSVSKKSEEIFIGNFKKIVEWFYKNLPEVQLAVGLFDSPYAEYHDSKELFEVVEKQLVEEFDEYGIFVVFSEKYKHNIS